MGSTEYMSDIKSRFLQIDNQAFPRTEVICPQPRRATRASCFLDGLSRLGPRPNGNLPMQSGGDCCTEILDIILSKDDSEFDLEGGNETSFFCGSPPVRTDNPVIQDAQFTKQNHFPASLRVERGGGSPTCGSSSFGGSPKVRIEGFALIGLN